MNLSFNLICVSLLAVTRLESIAIGCACPAYTLSGHAGKAKIVFLAEAIGKYSLPGAAPDNPARRVKLKVKERFKGKVSGSVWIYETGDPGCSASFPLHTNALLFLNALSTGIVSDCDVEFLEGEITADQREGLPPSMTAGKKAGAPHAADTRTAREVYLAGIIYYDKNKFDKAQEEWQHCVQIEPNNSDCAAGLQRLKDLGWKVSISSDSEPKTIIQGPKKAVIKMKEMTQVEDPSSP
jgi:hypothetical protein